MQPCYSYIPTLALIFILRATQPLSRACAHLFYQRYESLQVFIPEIAHRALRERVQSGVDLPSNLYTRLCERYGILLNRYVLIFKPHKIAFTLEVADYARGVRLVAYRAVGQLLKRDRKSVV